MAKTYVATEFTDKNGKHKVGEEIELPRDTDEQKSAFDTLIRTGIISTSKTRATSSPDEDDQEPSPSKVSRVKQASKAQRT